MKPSGSIVGDGFEELLHPSGLRFVRLPGGEIDVGMSERELADARERLGPVNREDEWRRIFDAAQPARRVVIEPFACALHPVPDALAPEDLRHRFCSIEDRDLFPEIAVRAWIDPPGVIPQHPFAVSGLSFGTWVRDGVRDGARGGAWSIWPVQDRGEEIVLHAAYRPKDDGVRGVLLAI